MENLQIVPTKNVEPQYVEMKVPLYSYGCERKVKKALSQLRGIYSVNVDYKRQKVTVWGICDKQDVLEKIKSKRRETRFWDPDHDRKDDQVDHQVNDVFDGHDDHQINKSMISRKLFRSLSWQAWKKGRQVLIRKFSLSPSFRLSN
ncbi:hypothetical protein Syun_020013 [Stephania yunnanensis]|uniref:HMA domain-containing protein n=1 Tax=Stephania yunnanensis TaxID=152371 RepID=A0AAP0NZX8_9MAGN